ncbi:hypothetical protein S245_004923, partial [Arachis hypogaea]
TKIPFEYPYLNSFSPNQKRKLKQKTLASPPPPQGLPLSVDLRHYHHRLVVRASSSFKNCSFFFLELGASVPGIHLLHRAPAAVRRALSHQRLRLVVADSSNLPLSSELCSSPGLCLHHDSASYSQTAQKKNPSPFQFPSFEFREQKLNQEKNLRLRRWFQHAAQTFVKISFFGAVSYLTFAITPFCIVFAVIWAVYRRASFAWISQDIL